MAIVRSIVQTWVETQEEQASWSLGQSLADFDGKAQIAQQLTRDLPELLRSIGAVRTALPAPVDLTEHSQPLYDQARGELDASREHVVGFLDCLTDVKHIIGKFVRDCASLHHKISRDYAAGRGDGVRYVAWSPDLYKWELNNIEEAARKCYESFQRLDECTRKPPSRCGLQALQDQMCQTAFSENDNGTLFENVVEQREKLKEAIDKEMKDRAKFVASEVHFQHQRQELDAAQVTLKRLQQLIVIYRNRRESLLAATLASDTQLQYQVNAIQRQIQEQHKVQMDANMRQLEESRNRLQANRAELQSKREAVDKLLLDTPAMRYGNHVIFVLDRSGSMAGTRWQLLREAVATFCSIRLREAAADVVSIVCFNSAAETLCCCEQVGPHVATKLDAVKPSGRTNFKPAWQAAQECAERTSAGFRAVVLFMSDGGARDISAAATCAQELHASRARHGGLLTFVVGVLDDGLAPASLEPLAKAGNGGRLKLQLGQDFVDLLQGVQSADLERNFQALASTVSYEHLALRAQGAAIDSLRRSLDERLVEDEASLSEALVRSEESAGQQASRLGQAVKQSHEEQRRLLKKQLEEVSKELSKLEKQDAEQTKKVHSLERSVKAAENAVKEAEAKLQLTIVNSQADRDMAQSRIDRLQKEERESEAAAMQRLRLMGTAGGERAARMHEAMDAFSKCSDGMRLLVSDASAGLKSLGDFSEQVVDQLRHPLAIDALRVDKANLVADLLLANMGLSAAQVDLPATPANLRCWLLREATEALQLSAPDKAVETLVAIFDWSALCTSGRDDKALEKQRSDCEKRLGQRLKRRVPGYSTKQSRVDKLTQDLEALHSRLEKKQVELERAVNNEPLEERLQREIERLEDTAEKLKDSLEEANEQLNAAGEQFAETHEETFRLLRHALATTHNTFKRFTTSHELRFLTSNCISMMESLLGPLARFQKTIAETEEAYRTVLQNVRSSPPARPQLAVTDDAARLALPV